MNNSANWSLELMEAANAALNRAKITLMSTADSAFFTTLCFNMKHTWSDKIPTAGCNGKDILWNPKFFMSLVNTEERVFLLLHETLHAAYLHMVRRPSNVCPDKWNIAADHVINLQLIARGFTMPTGVNKGHADEKYIGMSTEQVCALLPDNPGKPQWDDLMEPDGDLKQLEGDIADILVQAQIQSQLSNDKVGTIPGEIEIFLNKLLNSKLPWQRILQKYLHSFAKNDYTYKRPNRRFFPQYHLPSLYSENLMDLVIAVDTSGSVSSSDFTRFVSEIHGIMKMMKPGCIKLIQFDTDIKSVNNIKSLSDLIKVRFTGQGGTDIEPILEWANEHKPQLMLCFTDGGFSFPDIASKINYLWLINGGGEFTPPFGKVINYEI